ncbi:hypothetical protein SAMN05216475_3186 [Pseudomonas synxantha]|uniref:Threonine synthase n=1 Tax=Pseudomonas synxantha TaxID=47883 RepID=A0AAX3ID95_9PSED|nr:hypothetical protein SAMN05216475_3186 [Pseudomonas synxantha]VTR01837.1 Uncharacterised protein [Pseudomonas synxantha]
MRFKTPAYTAPGARHCGEGACSRWSAQRSRFLGAASRPSGSKLPRHRERFFGLPLAKNAARFKRSGVNRVECKTLWRGSLLPLECAALPLFWGRFATQREQAPSPQGSGCLACHWWRTQCASRPRRTPRRVQDIVARELAPAGVRSAPAFWGPLRDPAGASSLATGEPSRLQACVGCGSASGFLQVRAHSSGRQPSCHAIDPATRMNARAAQVQACDR